MQNALLPILLAVIISQAVAIGSLIVFPFSKPPIPSSREHIEKPQRKTTANDEAAQIDNPQSGGLRVVGATDAQSAHSATPVNQAKSHKEPPENRWLAPDGLTAILTGFLFGVGIGQVILFWRQLVYIRAGLTDTKHAADAAKESAETGRRTLVASQRAWIRVDEVTLAEDLHFSAGGVSTAIAIKITNIGNIPATNVGLLVTLMVMKPDGPFAGQELHKLCVAMRTQKLRGGFTIFPNDSFPRPNNPWKSSVVVGREEIEEARKASLSKDRICFHIIGCIDYTFQTDATVHHQTGFICDLRLASSQWVPLMEEADINRHDFTVVEHFSGVGGIVT